MPGLHPTVAPDRLEKVGQTFHYYSRIGVAAVRIEDGHTVQEGDELLFVDGRRRARQCQVVSMQCNRHNVAEASGPVSVGILTECGIRRQATVYRILPDPIPTSG